MSAVSGIWSSVLGVEWHCQFFERATLHAQPQHLPPVQRHGTLPTRPCCFGEGRQALWDPNVPGYWFQTTSGCRLTRPGSLVVMGTASGGYLRQRWAKLHAWTAVLRLGPGLVQELHHHGAGQGPIPIPVLNIFNHVNLANPDGCVDCLSNGVNTAARSPVRCQLALRSLTYGFKLSF